MSKDIRDPIHGFIEASSQALAVLDVPEFQRLRGINQLALTHLVYPGARHSRFEHSLGTMHTAHLLAEKVLPESMRKVTEIAALLHDVGHGPFSHVLDGVYGELGFQGSHEQISRALLPRFADSMEGDDMNVIGDLIDTPIGHRSAAHDVVSGPTDADKLDYLLRDSHFCGVQYGRFDLDRIVETVTMIGTDESNQLGFEEGGLHAVEGLLLARRSMHRQVYRQRTRRATDLMLTRAMTLAIGNGDSFIGRLTPDVDAWDAAANGATDWPNEAFLDGYLGLDDELVRRHLEKLEGAPGELAIALRNRDLVHEVVQLDAGLIVQLKSGRWLSNILDSSTMTGGAIGRIEASIAEDLDCEAHWVFLTVESESNPLYRPPGWDQTPGDIIIERKGRDDERFDELSDIWSESRPRPKYIYISLFTKRQEQEVQKMEEFDATDWSTYLIERIGDEIGD